MNKNKIIDMGFEKLTKCNSPLSKIYVSCIYCIRFDHNSKDSHFEGIAPYCNHYINKKDHKSIRLALRLNQQSHD